MKTVAPYGTWKSPLSVDALTDTDRSTDLVDVLVDPITSAVYHIEKRPAEGGRHTLLQTATGRDLTGGDWDVRNTVNGYGGAPSIIHDGVVYFSHVCDGRVYRVNVDGPSIVPDAITPENSLHKFADFNVYPLDPTRLICLMEDSTDAKSPSEVVNRLCILNVLTKTPCLLKSDASFYASPRFSPDGKRLAWIEWDLPDMPFTGAEVWIADVLATPNSLSVQNPRHVAGEHRKTSVAHPSWLSSDVLLFLSDTSGFENPWTYDCATGEAKPILATPIAESFTSGQPAKLGFSPYAVASADGTAVAFSAVKDGSSALYLVDIASGAVQLLAGPYVEIHHMRALRPEQNAIVFIGTTVDAAPALVQCTCTEPAFSDLQPGSHGSILTSEYISLPRPMSLPVPHDAAAHDVAAGTQSVHVVYYAPKNPEYAGMDGEQPPCILHVHGGPVSSCAQSFDATKQFFTTRGWAWQRLLAYRLDVNYGGSSGRGRAYTERLRGNWGVVDVADCISAARALSSPPYALIDPSRIVIRGPSAGGFTVLAALSMRADAGVFAAGTSLFGVSNLRRLAEETHKYESKFLTILVGEDPQLLQDRSPVFHAQKIVAPLLILQGDSDPVVPRSQADVIVDSIRSRGGLVEYKLYADEGHGWKHKSTIQDAILREFQFYTRVLCIEDDSV
ncbi:Alpha/Beta hydrolase protein [Mycena pura]|uniref:Alpha/Beta hydrolase protein n=1 Tax=Mycena pura TaxID=153505 RepID=A0AAD6VBM6_9AGAR|nr:Alpha/Beta hydrolase protein [Mycena pura]